MIDYLTEIPKIGTDSIKTGPFKDPRLVIWKSPNDLKGDGTALRKLSLLAKMQGKKYYQR